MQKGIFEVRTLTPLFLSGADLSTAELRTPPLRGVLRYWQRALIGGMVGTDASGLMIVQQAERSLFGTTGESSTVALKLAHSSPPSQAFNARACTRQGTQWQTTGAGYLLWSMAQHGKPEHKNFRPARHYFPPGTSFHLTLTTRDDNSQQFQQAVALLWLLTHLGGLGSRSRRCAGSLIAHPITPISCDLPFDLPTQAHDLKYQLEQGITVARSLHNVIRRTPQNANFDILASNTCRIWILQDAHPWPTIEVALQAIGKRLLDYRQSLPLSRRKIFGLPLPPLTQQRRPSPLLLRIAALRDNSYIGIALLFKTMANDIRDEDYAIIEQWIPAFPGALEVAL